MLQEEGSENDSYFKNKIREIKNRSIADLFVQYE